MTGLCQDERSRHDLRLCCGEDLKALCAKSIADKRYVVMRVIEGATEASPV